MVPEEVSEKFKSLGFWSCWDHCMVFGQDINSAKDLNSFMYTVPLIVFIFAYLDLNIWLLKMETAMLSTQETFEWRHVLYITLSSSVFVIINHYYNIARVKENEISYNNTVGCCWRTQYTWHGNAVNARFEAPHLHKPHFDFYILIVMSCANLC